MAIEIVTKNVTKSVREKNKNGTSDKENFTDPQGTKKPLSEKSLGAACRPISKLCKKCSRGMQLLFLL